MDNYIRFLKYEIKKLFDASFLLLLLTILLSKNQDIYPLK